MTQLITRRIGVTATREGLTKAQKDALTSVLSMGNMMRDQLGRPLELWLHHGRCLGGDEQAWHIARLLGYKTAAHPSVDAERFGWRGDTVDDVVHEALPPLERNRRIVHETRALIALPRGMQEELRSGTWATYRYARGEGHALFLIRPDGSVDHRPSKNYQRELPGMER